MPLPRPRTDAMQQSGVAAMPDMQGMTFDLMLAAATGNIMRPANGAPLDAAELTRQANGLAALLASVEPEPGASALALAPLGPEAIVTVLACLRAGIKPHFMSPAAGADRIAATLAAIDAPVAIGVAQVAELRPLLALREAAARSFSLRLLAGFGETLPDGVAPVAALAEAAAPEGCARPALAFGRDGGQPAEQAGEAEILQLAVEIAREIVPAPASRIVTTMSGVDSTTLASSFGLSLIAGIETTTLGVFDLARLWGCLSSSLAIHLVAPGSIEGALEEAGLIRHKALASLMLIHEPGENARPLAMPADAGRRPVVDIWRGAGRAEITRRR